MPDQLHFRRCLSSALLIGVAYWGEAKNHELEQRVAERLTIPHGDQSIRVTASIGIATLQPSGDMNTLVQTADNALYRAKTEGRNRVASYRLSDQT